jgi:thiamine-phosphate pyrophosphorylase
MILLAFEIKQEPSVSSNSCTNQGEASLDTTLPEAATMFDAFTEGALRALRRAEARAIARDSKVVEPIDLLTSLVDEEESRASALLSQFGFLRESYFALTLQPLEPPVSENLESDKLAQSTALKTILNDTTHATRAHDRSRLVSTENLLAGLIDGLGSSTLIPSGVDLTALQTHFATQEKADTAIVPLDPEIGPLELTDPGETADLARILDASANRAREGLRVVEDYVRFVLEDPSLTRRLKDVRHRFGEAIRGIDPEWLIGARDTRGDIGTHIMTAAESTRENPRHVLIANFKRTAEALRTLEEYSKLVNTWISGRFEILRYDVYTLEKLTLTAAKAHRTLADARLMVLVGGLPTLGDLTWIVSEALAGGADVIQLREKDIDDREWLSRAREVRILTAQAKARFIVNDRPDLARLAGADGVHLGVTDLTVRDARRIVGPNALVGLSTHTPAQLDKATLDAASYLGVGPVFPSETKSFEDFAGLEFVRHASESTTLPWFAIGGINESTIDDAIEAGARRVAVSAAVTKAQYPRKAAANLRAKIDMAMSSS